MTRVVSVREVREAAEAGRTVKLRPGHVVTPAARDLARQLGVRLADGSRGENGGHAGRSRVIAIGSDHGGYRLKTQLIPALEKLGFEIDDVGCPDEDSVDYPVYAARVAERVSTRAATFGIMIDGAGIGSTMVCNRFAGVRAALCYDLTTAQNAREHNNANVLALGGSLIGTRLASEIVETFLRTPFAGGRHQRRVAMIDALDDRVGKQA